MGLAISAAVAYGYSNIFVTVPVLRVLGIKMDRHKRLRGGAYGDVGV